MIKIQSPFGEVSMYKEKLQAFANQESLIGKAWQHAAAIDLIETSDIKDCSMHCFHYQQMLEMLLKFLLEKKSRYGAYPHTRKLNKLLEQLLALTDFKCDKNKYFMALQVITVCAEEYRYNFLLDCEGYKVSVQVANELLEQLIDWFGSAGLGHPSAQQYALLNGQSGSLP